MERTTGDDPLAMFEAESGVSMRDKVESRPDTDIRDIRNQAVVTSRPLMLETVLTRRTPVLWPEAVAIVEATCAVLRPSDGAELPAPESSHILLTSEGAIQVRTGLLGLGRGDSVPRLARTLHALTSGQAVPAPLRLLITKWIASDGSHSIAEFARELAYFGRPDGAQLIRDVYMRCLSMPAEEPQTPAPGQQRANATQKPPKPRRQFVRKGRGVWIAAAAVLLTIGVAAVLLSRSQQTVQGDPSDLLGNLMARAAEFTRSLGEMRTEVGEMRADLTAHLGTNADGASATPTPSASASPNQGRGAAPPAQRGAMTPAVGRALTSPPRASANSAARAARPAGAAAAAPAPAPAALESAVTLLLPAPEAAPVAPEVSVSVFAATPAVAAPVAADPNTLYSNADQDVSPPQLLHPQVPPVPVLFATIDDVNVMEIVVSDDGSVERVRLLSPPRRLTDMMLLSGAKNWRFAPASRNGQAVRYRMALSWSTTE